MPPTRSNRAGTPVAPKNTATLQEPRSAPATRRTRATNKKEDEAEAPPVKKLFLNTQDEDSENIGALTGRKNTPAKKVQTPNPKAKTPKIQTPKPTAKTPAEVQTPNPTTKTPRVQTPAQKTKTPAKVQTPNPATNTPRVQTPAVKTKTPAKVQTPNPKVKTPKVQTPAQKTKTPAKVQTPKPTVKSPALVQTSISRVKTPAKVQTPVSKSKTPVSNYNDLTKAKPLTPKQKLEMEEANSDESDADSDLESASEARLDQDDSEEEDDDIDMESDDSDDEDEEEEEDDEDDEKKEEEDQNKENTVVTHNTSLKKQDMDWKVGTQTSLKKQDMDWKDDLDRRSLFVKNFPKKTKPEDLRVLSKDVVEVFHRSHLGSQKQSLRWAILRFKNEAIAIKNHKLLNGVNLEGQNLHVDFVGSKSKTATRPYQNVPLDPLLLYVSGLPHTWKDLDLNRLFPKAKSAHFAATRKHKKEHQKITNAAGFGFVHFDNQAAAKLAHDKMQGKTVEDRTLVVMYAHKRLPRTASKTKQQADSNMNGPLAKKAKLSTKQEESDNDDDDDDDDDEEEEDDDEEEEDDDSIEIDDDEKEDDDDDASDDDDDDASDDDDE